MRWIAIFLGALGLIGQAMADQYQCPGNTNYVGTGDSLQQVVAACGKPMQTIQQQGQASPAKPSLIWFYVSTSQKNIAQLNKNGLSTSPQGLAAANAGLVAGRNPALVISRDGAAVTNSGPTTVDLGVVFAKGQVVAIQKRGRQGALKSFQCGSGTIQIGSSVSDVTAACGLPAIQRVLPTPKHQAPALPMKSTQLIYHSRSYLPPTIFIFNGEGKLIGQK